MWLWHVVVTVVCLQLAQCITSDRLSRLRAPDQQAPVVIRLQPQGQLTQDQYNQAFLAQNDALQKPGQGLVVSLRL